MMPTWGALESLTAAPYRRRTTGAARSFKDLLGCIYAALCLRVDPDRRRHVGWSPGLRHCEPQHQESSQPAPRSRCPGGTAYDAYNGYGHHSARSGPSVAGRVRDNHQPGPRGPRAAAARPTPPPPRRNAAPLPGLCPGEPRPTCRVLEPHIRGHRSTRVEPQTPGLHARECLQSIQAQ